jgi:hypothetical protein
MRRLLFLAAAGALLVTLPAVAANATPPTDVVIVSPLDLNTGTGTFAVTEDGGEVLCDEGSVENLLTRFVGDRSDSHAQILVSHEFTCDDGSGSFLLSLRVRLDFATGNTSGSWSVLDGTGDFAKLHGSGSVVGTLTCGPDCILDTYTGGVHIN